MRQIGKSSLINSLLDRQELAKTVSPVHYFGKIDPADRGARAPKVLL